MRAIGLAIWRFMVIFSFIVNIVLVVVLIAAGIFIFDIKQNVADPLIGGLHSTAAGLNDATIDWTIPVRDNIPVNLDIQLTTDTVVILNEPVPLAVDAIIDLPGLNATNVPARVNLTLPAGLQLPVALDVPVPVRERLDVALDVRAVIPLAETQLADPIETLGLLFEPLAIGLHNLPNDFGEAGQFVQELIPIVRDQQPIDQFLLATDGSGFNAEPYDPWLGYSSTAGLNYNLLNQPVPVENQAVDTDIVPPGGIPLLDALIRPQLYQNDQTPAQINQIAIENLRARNIPNAVYDGTMVETYLTAQENPAPPPATTADGGIIESQVPAVGGSVGQPVQSSPDLGIMPTPTTP